MRTARPARRASFQPKKSWMQVFSNWCGTESARPTIQSLWIPSGSWTPCLKVETPFGPCWRRYNHDGYGQREDGGPFVGWGRGRAWPLLTGERGHYELAAGHDTKPFIRAMEAWPQPPASCPSRSWDGPDQPEVYMYCGRPTGSAMPLMWAHAEYIKLLRSVRDGKVSDLIADVAKRYLGERADRQLFEVWKPTRQVRRVKRGYVLRIQVPASFRLHWSDDEWQTVKDTPSSATTLGVEFVDIPILRGAAGADPLYFLLDGKRVLGRTRLSGVSRLTNVHSPHVPGCSLDDAGQHAVLGQLGQHTEDR